MRTKASRDMCQLSEDRLFQEVGLGLDLIYTQSSLAWSDAEYLSANNRPGGFNILEAIAEEEAAKFLVLLDAVRCPRNPQDAFVKQLGRFDDHLAKGIYAFCYGLLPSTFHDVRELVERECHEYYLDGPNDFDWIFRNEILQMREERIYVDYVESEGEHIWVSPERYHRLARHPLTPWIVQLAEAMWKAGFSNPGALAMIAHKWRPVGMTDDFTWSHLRKLNVETLEELEKAGLLQERPGDVYSTIIEKWLFPLYALDIRIIKVNKAELKESRERNFLALYY